MSKNLEIVPITLADARHFVDEHHRHHKAPQGGLFAVAVAQGPLIVGVGIAGRPVARNLDDAWTAEVTRACVLSGYANGCSMIYGALWRAARALGYRRCVTYTLITEAGTSMKASGWKCIGECGGGAWSRRERPRTDSHVMSLKLRWEVSA